MNSLVDSARSVSRNGSNRHFSVYSSAKEQRISNVPIIKPLLIVILNGVKILGGGAEGGCVAGSFVFLSNSPTIDMRNIPGCDEYLAVLIEFDYADFDQFRENTSSKEKLFQGTICPVLEKYLQQYIDCAAFSPLDSLSFRRQELLQLLYQLGHTEVSAIAEPPSLSQQLHELIRTNLSDEWSAEELAASLMISESTLRRRLSREGTSVQAIKNRVKLGHGLHLLQTSMEPIGRIAEYCGYQSQSRFTEQFKQLFGLTPSALRKTKARKSYPG